jgi:hypothetical protein
MERVSFPMAFARRENFFIWGNNFYEEFERYVKMPCKRAAVFMGPCWGT